MSKNKEIKEEINKAKNTKVVVEKDRIIILSIVISVITVCLVTFGVYMYKTNYKAIAKFDGGELSRENYSLYYKMFMPMLQMYGYPPEAIPAEIARKAGLDRIILMLAKSENMTLTDEEKKSIDDTFKDEKQVQQMKDSHMDLDALRDLYEADALIQKYIKKMEDSLTDQEVKDYLTKEYGKDVDLKEYVTRNLLIATTDKNTGNKFSDADKAKAKAKAENIIARLNNGENFEKLVKEFSDDEGTKSEGGLYSVYMDERTVKEYKDAAVKLQEGKYTTVPVETQFGYHIIYLEKINLEGRLKSESERASAVNGKLEDLVTKYNLKVDEKSLENYSNYLNDEIKKIQQELINKMESQKKDNEVDVYDKK